MKTVRKMLVAVVLLAVLTACAFQIGSMLKCEFLTDKHGEEVLEAYKSDEAISYWVSGYDWAKVVSCSDESACVYYVHKGDYGMTVTYKRVDGVWNPKDERTLWSKHGSADERIWPYWYHGLF